MANVRERLIELRESNGLNKAEMAKKIGTTKLTITRYESGNIKPNLDAMLKIRDAFGKSLDWIAGIDTDKEDEYTKVVDDCIVSDITPDHLQDTVDFIKKQRKM